MPEGDYLPVAFQSLKGLCVPCKGPVGDSEQLM